MSATIYRQAAARAAVERARLGLGSEPVVDIRALVERQGALVYSTPVPGGALSGCFALIDGDAWIMVNSADSVGRQRFTIAHEYCHSLAHRDLEFIVCTSEKPAHEKYADAFAAAFLMPTDSAGTFFASDLKKGVQAERVIDYCYAFGVSYQAAVFRLHNLGILSAPRRDALLQEAPLRVATAMGYDVQDTGSPFFRDDKHCGWSSESLPRAYRSAALRAYDEELISESKLAELLGVDADDLDDLLDPIAVEEVPVAW